MSTEFVWNEDLAKEYAEQYRFSSGRITVEQFKESKKRKPVFVTEDGIEKFGGDTIWVLGIDKWIISRSETPHISQPFKGDRNQFKYFSSEEAANDYILFNKPLLSLNEIKTIGEVPDPENHIHFKRLIEAAKNNLNK